MNLFRIICYSPLRTDNNVNTPTVKGQLPLGGVPPAGVLGQALVDARVLLLEVGDLQDPAGLVHVHLAAERRPVRPAPAHTGHRAGGGRGRHTGEPCQHCYKTTLLPGF